MRGVLSAEACRIGTRFVEAGDKRGFNIASFLDDMTASLFSKSLRLVMSLEDPAPQPLSKGRWH